MSELSRFLSLNNIQFPYSTQAETPLFVLIGPTGPAESESCAFVMARAKPKMAIEEMRRMLAH